MAYEQEEREIEEKAIERQMQNGILIIDSLIKWIGGKGIGNETYTIYKL